LDKFEHLLAEAREHLDQGRLDEAIGTYRVAADAGNWIACTALGTIYERKALAKEENEKAAKQNYIMAAHWYTRALESGDYKEPHYGLGQYYFHNTAGQFNFKKALHHLLKAAPEENPIAALMLGELYLDGFGTAQSFEKARYYFEVAAEQEYVAGYIGLGRADRRQRNLIGSLRNWWIAMCMAVSIVIKDRNDRRLTAIGGKRGTFQRKPFLKKLREAEQQGGVGSDE
jgi:TPR repeat protein